MKVHIIASKSLLAVLSIVFSILLGMSMFIGVIMLLTFIKEVFNGTSF